MTRMLLRRMGIMGLLALMLTSCAGAPAQPTAAPTATQAAQATAPVAVTADGDGLKLGGRAWWPAGLNAPQLGTDWSVNRGCGAEVDLDEFFGSLPPNSLTRFNLFQALSVSKHNGQLDFGPADAVFAAAGRHGQKLLPVLAAQDGACGDEVEKERGWFVTGWRERVAAGNVLTFEQWVDTAVRRWRGSAALAGWELIGEPDPGLCGDSDCSHEARICPPDAAQVLRGFMDEAGALVRQLDPGRLIFAGLIGGGQCGTGGDEYALVGGSPNIDVLEYHDYGADGLALPGDQWNGLALRITQAQTLGKPLLVAEIGELAGSCGSLERRRASIDRKITGQRAAGTAGALLWAFVPDPRLGECTMDIGPEDPLRELLAERNTVG